MKPQATCSRPGFGSQPGADVPVWKHLFSMRNCRSRASGLPLVAAGFEHVVAGGKVAEGFLLGQPILRHVRKRDPLNDVGRKAFAVGGAEDGFKRRHRVASSWSIRKRGPNPVGGLIRRKLPRMPDVLRRFLMPRRRVARVRIR